MDRAAPSPLDPPAGLKGVSSLEAGSPRSCQSLEARPFSAPRPAATGFPRKILLDGLRERIRTLERHAPLESEDGGHERPQSRWLLGAPGIDVRLGSPGLDHAGLHELKPSSSSAGARARALAFALGLAVRRMNQLSSESHLHPHRILWCWPERFRHEAGHLYGPGLKRLGLDPRALLIVETARKTDALWAIEEGLKSASLALVIGVLDEVALTPARRISLACAEHKTPCLMMTSARAPAIAATATRWRIATGPGAAHPFDPHAPGAARFAVALERCRGAKPGPETSYSLEWSHETHCFRMAADMARRAPEAARTACRAR